MNTRTWNDVIALWIVSLITLAICQFAGCGVAHAEPNYDQLCDSIRIAEGNSNYGILSHYHHTSYRQASINTCHHAWRDYFKTLPWGEKATKTGYLAFLANLYAPIGAKNDPKGLNRNWLANVSKLYKGDI